jgi:hypothetical protein
VVHILNFVVSFGVISLLFAMILKYLPDVKVPFRKVWVGAITTAFRFTVGKYLLALYLGRASTTSSFGAAGSVILIMMWVYYASVILLVGAEFTHVYVKQTTARILTTKYAEPMTQEEQAKQGIPQQPRLVPQRRPGGVLAEPLSQSRTQPLAPGAVLRRRPLQLAGLMLVAGFTVVLLVRFKGLRKFARLYLDTHKT